MFCSKCGAEVPDNQKFCTSCGNELIKTADFCDTEKKEKKRFSKKLFLLIIPFVLILSIFIGSIIISSKKSDSENYNNYEDDYYEDDIANDNYDVDVTSEDTEEVSSEQYAEQDPDGTYILKRYSETSYIMTKCFDDNTEDDERFAFASKHIDEGIVKLPISNPIGVYDEVSQLTMYKIDSQPQYTVAMNFYDGLLDGVNDFPDPMYNSGGSLEYGGWKEDNIDFSVGNVTSPGCPITECQGEDLETFVNENSYWFWGTRHEHSGGHDFLILKADKREEFEFGGYVGTSFETFTAYATFEYYKIYDTDKDGNIGTSIPVNKTKKGYFEMDLSDYDPGVYYVREYDTFIELV